MSVQLPDPAAAHPLLVTTQWLADHLEDPGLVLIDAGEAVAYRRAHIRGAAGLPHPYLKGRANDLLVMPPEEFSALARRLGISSDSEVIVYDDNASLHAARVWWVFWLYGHERVRVVDGGLNAWLEEGRPLTSAPARRPEGTFQAHERAGECLSLADVRAALDSGSQIWDARSEAEWAGTESRENRRAGHLPGAQHLEWFRVMQGPPYRRFRPPAEIRGILEGAGLDPSAATVTYCQSGIRAAFATFVLRLLGNDGGRPYDGSMAEWANRDDTPLTTAVA
jgi:thiosulfate/3-mercaptopyruvate sulfurtransferase